MYVDAAYCYRPTSMVCWCLSLTVVSPAKMAEPIEVLFGMRTWVGPRNHVLDGGSDLPMGKGNFGWRRLIVKYRDRLPWAVHKRLTDRDAVWDAELGGPKEPLVRSGLRSLHGKEQLWEGKSMPGMTRWDDTLPWAVQQWLNRWRRCFSMDSGGPKETCWWGYTLAQPDEFDSIVPSMFQWTEWSGGDAALRQITLTTC